MRLSIILFFLGALVSAEESVYEGKLQKIQDFNSVDLASLHGKPALFYAFQPNCESCQRQSRDLDCLSQDLQIFAIGVFGSLDSLKKEFRRHYPRAIPLYGGNDWQKKWKIKKTPTLLVVDSRGQVVFRAEQRIECVDLVKTMKSL
jgi:thiol-disulfide isomerase/thioredoxin